MQAWQSSRCELFAFAVSLVFILIALNGLRLLIISFFNARRSDITIIISVTDNQNRKHDF